MQTGNSLSPPAVINRLSVFDDLVRAVARSISEDPAAGARHGRWSAATLRLVQLPAPLELADVLTLIPVEKNPVFTKRRGLSAV